MDCKVGEVGTGATSEIVESFYVALWVIIFISVHLTFAIKQVDFHSIRFLSDLIPAIVGKKGATIKRIITETKTRIVLPQDNNMKLEIFGNDRQSVALAKQQIMSTVRVMSNRFNIIRITDSGIIKNYERFKVNIEYLNFISWDECEWKKNWNFPGWDSSRTTYRGIDRRNVPKAHSIACHNQSNDTCEWVW